jgi:phenylpyruvate tautomerase PptA (4-oxalocrotonate tautomerase family)
VRRARVDLQLCVGDDLRGKKRGVGDRDDLVVVATNTAAFIHNMDAAGISNLAGESNHVRVQVHTPVGVLDRDKQLGVVKELTDIVAAAARDPSLRERTWVLLTESPEGGRGIGGHANTNAHIAAAARAALAGQ